MLQKVFLREFNFNMNILFIFSVQYALSGTEFYTLLLLVAMKKFMFDHEENIIKYLQI